MTTVIRSRFVERVIVALALAVTGSIGFFGLTTLFTVGESLRLTSVALATAYACWLVYRSGEPTGRLLVALCWLVAAIVLLALYLPAIGHLVVLALMVWLVRALYCYGRPLTAVLDLGVVLFALLAGVWALQQTESALLSVWSTFLVLSVFVLLPNNQTAVQASSLGATPNDEVSSARFEQARHDAQVAIEKLTRA